MPNEKEIKYTKTFRVTYVQCLGCGQMMQPTQGASALSNQAMHDLARQLHSKSKIICVDPKFVIGYIEELTDTRIITKAASDQNGRNLIEG